MKQEKIISYRAGITRTPSDFLSREGELAECINLVTDHEELKVVVDPVEDGSVPAGARLLFVHSLAGRKNRIILLNNALWCDSYDLDGERMAGFPKAIDGYTVTGEAIGMQAVGNTLILSTSGGLAYFLWKGDLQIYKSLGSKIPDPEIRFVLIPGDNIVSSWADVPDDVVQMSTRKVFSGRTADYRNLVVGLYSEIKKKADKRKCFYAPFAVRYAIELYDTTLILQSNPILMFPAVGANLSATPYVSRKTLLMHMWTSELAYKFNTDYSDWKDIVKNIGVFVTKQEDVYDTTEDNLAGAFGEGTEATVKPVSANDLLLERIIASNPTIETRGYMGPRDETGAEYYILGETDTHVERIRMAEGQSLWDVLKKRSIGDILDDLKEDGIYYKLCDIGLTQTGDDTYRNISTLMDKKALQEQETQERMVQQGRSEDYYSHASMKAGMLKTYNGRLHLADTSRGIYPGFGHFSANGAGGTSYYEIYVRIRTNDGTRTAYRDLGRKYEKFGNYFFYPDTRAYEAVIVKDHDTYCVLSLTEHPALNGSYYITSPLDNLTFTSEMPEGLVPDMREEYLPNVIAVSDVNNPFVFNASGYVTVGTGRVIGIASQTMALGQEEHGIHPLTVFTTKGLSALTLNSEGVYVRSDEFSREVCINPESITETDGAVFFVSKKGLMVVEGRQVRCMTGQMNGMVTDTAVMPGLSAAEMSSPSNAARPWQTVVTPCQGTGTFLEYIRDSRLRIAYDYTDSRLLLINPSFGYAYSFGMADGAVTKVILPAAITNVVSDYPDNLMQDTQGTVWSLYGKPREDEVDVRKRAFLLSRPMKLSGPLTVTSLRELVNVGMWNRSDGSEVKTELWVSDDMQSWYPMSSRFGAAARYYRIALYVDMLPTERLSGTIVMDQERRTDNKRT